MVNTKLKLNQLFGFLLCLLFIGFSKFVVGGTWELKEESGDEFSQGLQLLVDSSVQLELNNNDSAGINEELRKRLDDFAGEITRLQQENGNLQKRLDEGKERNKDKEGKLNEVKSIQDQRKMQLDELEKEIAINKIHLAERRKQQSYLLELMAIVQKNGKVDLDHSVIMDNQSNLKTTLKKSLDRNKILDKEWLNLAFWYGDSKVSSAELTRIKEQLETAIKEFKKENVSENWAKNHYQLQKLDMEIKSLIQQRNSLVGALEHIENKYVGSEKKADVLQEENKIQSNLVKLKRENKILQKKVNELKLGMIDLDKKKTALERVIEDY